MSSLRWKWAAAITLMFTGGAAVGYVVFSTGLPHIITGVGIVVVPIVVLWAFGLLSGS